MIKAHNKRESNTETRFNGLFYRCRFRSRGGGRTKANMYSTIFMKNHFEGYKIPPRYVTRVRSESILTLKCSQINSSHTGILINFSADKKHWVHGTHDCVTTLFAFSWFLLKPWNYSNFLKGYIGQKEVRLHSPGWLSSSHNQIWKLSTADLRLV